MKRRALLAVLVLIPAAVAGYFVYQAVTFEQLNLEPLLPYAKTENYLELVKRIQAHAPADAGFSFVALGDTRSNLDMARKVVGAAASEKPAFVLGNGDIVRRGRPEEYLAHHLRLVELIKPLPFITVPGNHEEGPNRDFGPFIALFGAEQFSFDYGNARFVGINDSRWYGIGPSQLKYLETELSKPGVKYKFVAFHVPPRDMSIFVDSDEGRGFRWNAQRLRTLMTAQHVNAVFMGHVHGFAQQTVDGVKYIVTGGAGANLAERLPEEGRVHNYVVVKVSPETVQYEVVRLVNNEWVRSEF